MFACSVVWKQFFLREKIYIYTHEYVFHSLFHPFVVDAFENVRKMAAEVAVNVIFGLWKGVGGRGRKIVRSGAIIVSFDRADASFRGGKLEG